MYEASARLACAATLMSDYCRTVLCPHWALITFGDTPNPWSLIVHEWYLPLIRRVWIPLAFATVMYDSSNGTVAQW